METKDGTPFVATFEQPHKMKTAKSLLISSLCALQSFLLAQIPTNGLIGEWTFTGNALDASPSSNHGTVMGAKLIYDRCGNPCSAYRFDGNSKIVMQQAGVTGNAPRSLAFWMRTTQTTVYQIMVAFDYGNNLAQYDAWQVVMNYCSSGIGHDNCNQAIIRPATNMFDGKWHHVAVVYDPQRSSAIGGLIHYFDGVQVTSMLCNVSGTNTSFNTSNVHPITIGMHAYGYERPYIGDLDDYYFYNRALSQTEVVQIMNTPNCQRQEIAELSPKCLGTTGINEIDNGLGIYPNPTSGILKINCNSDCIISVINNVGQVITTLELSQGEQEVDLRNLTSGLYFISLKGTRGSQFLKILKTD